jgi:hypothetical protein
MKYTKRDKNIERINKRLKKFRILKEEWRHDLIKHHKIFIIIAGLTNLILKTESPLDKQ